jgi:serine/threonine-protein kinase
MPTKLGKYVIKSELGRGAMGVVYRAEDPRLGRPVALKTMSPSVAGDPELLQRFYREAQSAGKLSHPNIVTIYDIDEADGIPFIAMEFLEGESLKQIIATRKDLTIVKKVDVMVQTCRGLHYAHQHGIVHRDVKPANIVVVKDGTVRIVDFGIARIAGGSMTRTGIVLGTPMYMSPEQVLGHAVDARSDIFSAGVILYELLTFQNPFVADDMPTILFKIVDQPAPALASVLPNCPPQLDNIVMRALAKNREERYQAAEDLAFDLQQVGDFLKRHMVEVYIEQGQRSYEEGNFTLAKESLQKVLEIDSNHNVAKSLLSMVQEQIYARQRAQKVEQALRHAKEALGSEQFEEAIGALDEILRLDPGHAEAQQYKQLAIERRDRKRKVARHMERAEELLADADLKGAKAQLQAALALEPEHAAALTLLESVTRELAEEERLRQVRQYIESARARLAEKNFAKARELLEKAGQLDPINMEVESLSRLVRSNQEKEERRRLLEQRLAGIQEAINREQYEEAVTLVEQALGEFPDHPDVLKLHTQATRLAEAQRKRRYVDEQIQTARGFLQENQFSSAIALLQQALQVVPGDSRLTSYLKTVREAEERARLESLRQEAIRQANEQIRAKDFVGAITTLEKALGRAGQSPELLEFLQFAREQQVEYQRQERIHHLMSRAQAVLREEDFEEAADLLERSQTELQAIEIESLLTTVREQWQRFEQQREETLNSALQLQQEGEAAKAVALLDAAPKAYFKNERFQQVYAQCREGLGRATLVRSTVEQVETAIVREDLAQAEALLQQALRTCPNDPTLLATRQRLREEEVRLRRALWSKLLDEARVDVGRMQYKEAIALLTSVDWESAEVPELSNEAAALLREARQRYEEVQRQAEEEAAPREEEAWQPQVEIEQAQTLIRPGPSRPAADSSGLLASQERLREALRAGPRRREAEAARAPSVESTLPASRPPLIPSPPAEPPVARPTARPAVAPKPTPPPAAELPAPAPPTRVTAPPAAPTVVTPRVAPVAVPVPTPRPAVARAPVAIPAPAPAKRMPVALWAGIGVVVLAIVGFAAWRFMQPPAHGYAQLVATPWAEIVSVETKEGQNANLTGTTPMRLELPPGDYVVEFKKEQAVGKVSVVVRSGETSQVNYTFPEVDVNAMVDELVSKY